MRDDGYRGSEEIEGEFRPISLGEAMHGFVESIRNYGRLEKQCESPIEAQLAARLLVDLKPPFTLEPQFRFRRYRIDFAVLRDGIPCLFIECDGKEFHSTPEQRANDLDKNQAAAQIGVPMLRFTGSHIFRRPDECSRKIVALLEGLA